MDAMTMPNNVTLHIPNLIKQIQADFPDITFEAGSHFSWHAKTRHVSYLPDADDPRSLWALLHELGHALLNHTDFSSDIELLNIEVAAWAEAHRLAEKYGITIDQNYIEDNLDSYRDWLHVRATCPTCYERSLQIDRHTYRCHNCGTEWRVTRSRLCRPYRRKTS